MACTRIRRLSLSLDSVEVPNNGLGSVGNFFESLAALRRVNPVTIVHSPSFTMVDTRTDDSFVIGASWTKPVTFEMEGSRSRSAPPGTRRAVALSVNPAVM